MSLEGAQFICLDEAGNRGEIVLPKDRQFTVGYYATCDFVLTDDKALGIHCTIERDGFGRISIRNRSLENPVLVNGHKVENKRNLFHDSIITILDKRYLWQFSSHCDKGKNVKSNSDDVSTPEKQIGVPEHTGFSSPFLKAKKVISRFTVHNFAHYIKPDEEGNSSTEPNRNVDDETPEKINEMQKEEEEDRDVSPEASEKQQSPQHAQAEREATPEPEDEIPSTCVQGTPKMDLINCTNNKENTGGSSHKKKRHQLSMCHQSEVVITSFSPRKAGVTTEKSFTAILMPKVLVTRAPNTPKSVYSTPRSVLDDDDDDNDDQQINKSRDIDFQTPSTSQKASALVSVTASKVLKNSSMHLVDFTTPKKYAPASPYLKSALKASAKKHLMTPGVSMLPCTPVVGDDNRHQTESPSSVQSVISVDSTDTSSVIEILSDASTPGLSLAKTPQKSDTTKTQTSSTPMKTPQSLIKRSMLNSKNNKQITTPQRRTPDNVQTTPRREPINRIPLRSTSIASLRSPVTAKPTGSDLHGNRIQQSVGTTPSARKIMAALKFESTPSSNTKFATPSPPHHHRSFMPRSACKAPTTSTPLAARSYNRYSGCNTTPLNKVRKSLGGIPLSSHISKARRSIIAAAPSKYTSIKEKSPQQKMSDKIVYRARTSVGGVTPMIARAINMVQASKDSPRNIVRQTPRTSRNSMGPLTAAPSYTALFSEKQSKEQTIDRSLTFIVDSDEEGSGDANKMTKKKNVGEKEPPSQKEEENVCIESKEKQQILNLTFSPPQKEKVKTLLPTTDDETPVDVEEVPQCVEEAAIINAELHEQKEEHKGDGSHISLSSQTTEESFAEEIQNAQKGEEYNENGRASEVPAQKSKEVDAGFGEEPEVLATKELSQTKGELDNSSQVYKPIYEDITLEGSTLEKDAKDENVLETKKTCDDDEPPSSSLDATENIAASSSPIAKALTADLPDVAQDTDQEILETSADKDDAGHNSSADQVEEVSEEKACEEQILAGTETEEQNEHDDAVDNAEDEETTRRLLDEIEDVLNKSDEFDRKHSNQPEDNEHVSQENNLESDESNDDQGGSDKGEIKVISDTCNEASIPKSAQDEVPEELEETQPATEEYSLQSYATNDYLKENVHLEHNTDDIQNVACTKIDISKTVESIATGISHDDNEENNKDTKALTHASKQFNLTDSKQGKEQSDDEELTSSCHSVIEELESKENVSSEAEKHDMLRAADSPTSQTRQEINLEHKKSKYTLSEIASNENQDDERVEAENKQQHSVVEESISMCPRGGNEELIEEVNLTYEETNTQDCRDDEGDIEQLKSMMSPSPSTTNLRPESNLEIEKENKGAEYHPSIEKDSNTNELSPANDEHICQENKSLRDIEKEKELCKESNCESEENQDDTYENQQAEDDDNNEESLKETVELNGNSSLTTEETDNQAPPSTSTSVKNEETTKEAPVAIAGEHNDSDVLSTMTSSVPKDEIEKVSQSPIELLTNTIVSTVAVENSDNTDDIINPIIENKSEETATPKRATRRKSISGQLKVTSLGTPSKNVMKIESELAPLTPRHSLRRTSLTDKPAVVIENPTTIHTTPRRSTRRASMSVDVASSSYTPMMTIAKSRRASLSDTPLTPKRITRRRSSMSLDTDEAVNIVKTPSETSGEQPTNIIYEENMEDMGAIIEEEEQQEESEETSVLNTVVETGRDATVSSSSQEKKPTLICSDIEKEDREDNDDHTHTPAVVEENLFEVVIDQQQQEEIGNQSNQTPTLEVNELIEQVCSTPESCNVPKTSVAVAKESEVVSLREEDEENVVAEVVLITEHNIPEAENILHNEAIISAQDKTQNRSHSEEDVGEVVNDSMQEPTTTANINEFNSSADGENSVRDMIPDESICEVVTEAEMELLNIEKGQPEMSVTAVNVTAEEDMETLEVSDDESIYDYGKEVQEPFTPKLKNQAKPPQAKTPKTPLLSGVRKLFNTPKPEQSTPILESIRYLVRTPKNKTQDTPKGDLHPATDTSSSHVDEKGLTAVRVLLKTPKYCETPRFKGMRELMQTPKASVTPMMDGVKELLDTSEQFDDEKQSEDIGETTRCHDFEAATTALTPKTCSTSRFRGMRELRQTPKVNLTHDSVGVEQIINSPEANLKTQSENIEEKEEIDYLSSMQNPEEFNELILNQSISEEEEDHKIYRGVKELMKTPKGCSTPRFRGMREMMKTPKTTSATPALGGVKELLRTPPKQDETNLDKFLKTPTAKNIMIPTLPSSAVIEKSEDSVEMVHSIEYDLNDTHEAAPCSNLGELFKTPLASRFVDRLSVMYVEEDEAAASAASSTQMYADMPTNSQYLSSESKTPTVLNRRSLALKTPLAESPFSTADILTDLSTSEVENWVDKIDPLEQTIDANKEDDDNVHKTKEESKRENSPPNDSLSVVPETCLKPSLANVSEAMINISSSKITASKDPLDKSTSGKSKSRNDGQPVMASCETADISGICLLDESESESVLHHSLIVSEEDDYDDDVTTTNEGNNSLNMSSNNKDDTLYEDAVDDLSEPLLLSDDDDDGDETVEHHHSTDEHKNDGDSKMITKKSLVEAIDKQTSKLKQQQTETATETAETLPSNISVDIFHNDSVEAGEAATSVDETMRDASVHTNPHESTAENVTISNDECEDIFMEDSVIEHSESIKNTTTEPEEDIISGNEVDKCKVIEFEKATGYKRGDVDAKVIAKDTHVELIASLETSANDGGGGDKIVNENVPSSSKKENGSQTSSIEDICLENKNDASVTESTPRRRFRNTSLTDKSAIIENPTTTDTHVELIETLETSSNDDGDKIVNENVPSSSPKEIENKNDAGVTQTTPKRSLRRTSLTDKSAAIIENPTTINTTPRRSTRRASMSVDLASSSYTPMMTIAKSRRASLSDTPLTPKRITRRRSSMSLDTDEAVNFVKTPKEQPTNINYEENIEDMGAIIEEEEQQEESEETSVPSSSSQKEIDSRQTSSSEVICIQNTNDDAGVAQTGAKTPDTDDNIKENATSKTAGGKTDDVIPVSGSTTCDEVVQSDTVGNEKTKDILSNEECLKPDKTEKERVLEIQSVENIDVDGSNSTPVKTIKEAVAITTDADIGEVVKESEKKNVNEKNSDEVSPPLCKEESMVKRDSNESKSKDANDQITLIPDNQPSLSSLSIPEVDVAVARKSIASTKPVETRFVEMPVQSQIEDSSSSDETHKNFLTKTNEIAKDEIPVEANKMTFIEVPPISTATTEIEVLESTVEKQKELGKVQEIEFVAEDVTTEKEVTEEIKRKYEKNDDTNVETEEMQKQVVVVGVAIDEDVTLGSKADVVVQMEIQDIENVEDVIIKNVKNLASDDSVTFDDGNNDITVSETDKNSAASSKKEGHQAQNKEITSALYESRNTDRTIIIDSDSLIEQVDQNQAEADKFASEDCSELSRSSLAPQTIAEDTHFADDLNYLPSKSLLITESDESLANKVQAENDLEEDTVNKSKVEQSIDDIPLTEIIPSEAISSEPDNNTTAASMSIKEHVETKTIMTEKNLSPVVEEVSCSSSAATELDKMMTTVKGSITQNESHSSEESNLNIIKTKKPEEEELESCFSEEAAVQSFDIEVKIRDIASERVEQTPQKKPNKRLHTRKGSQSSVCSKDSDNEVPKTRRGGKEIEESNNEQRNPGMDINPDSDEIQSNEIENRPETIIPSNHETSEGIEVLRCAEDADAASDIEKAEKNKVPAATTVPDKETTIPTETSEGIDDLSCADDTDAPSDIEKAEKNKVPTAKTVQKPGLAKNTRRKPSHVEESEDSQETSAAKPTAQDETSNQDVSDDDHTHKPAKSTRHKPSRTKSKPNAAADAVQNTESENSKIPLAFITADTENTTHISSKDIKPVKASSAECILDNASVLSKIKEIDEPLLEINVIQKTDQEVLTRTEEMEVCPVTPAQVEDTKVATLENPKPAKRTLRKASQLTSDSSTEVHKEIRAEEVIQDDSSVNQTHDENISQGASTSSQEPQHAKRSRRKPSKSERKLVEKPSKDKDNDNVLQRIEDIDEDIISQTAADPKENTETMYVENETSESLEQKDIKEQTAEEKIMEEDGFDLIQSEENAVTKDVIKITESSKEAIKEHVERKIRKPSHQENKAEEVTEVVISKVEENITIAPLVEEPKDSKSLPSSDNVVNTEHLITEEEEPKPATKRQRRKASSDSTHEGSCSSHSRMHYRQKRLEEKKELVIDVIEELKDKHGILENSNEISEMTEEPPTKPEISKEPTRRRRKASQDSTMETDAKQPKKISSRKPCSEESNVLDNIKETEEDECLLLDNKQRNEDPNEEESTEATEMKQVEGTTLVTHHSNEVVHDTNKKEKDGQFESDVASRQKISRPKRAHNKNKDKGEEGDAMTAKTISQNNESDTKDALQAASKVAADTGAQSSTTTTRRNRRKASQDTEQDSGASTKSRSRPHKAEKGTIVVAEAENLSKIVEFYEKIQVTDGREDVLETKATEVAKGKLEPIEICRDNQVQSRETAEEPPNIGSTHHETTTTKRNVATKRDRRKASHEKESSNQQNLKKATEQHNLPTAMEEENVGNKVETLVDKQQETESGKDAKKSLNDESLNEKCIKPDAADVVETATIRTRLEKESETEGGDINKNDDPKNIDKTRRAQTRRKAPAAAKKDEQHQSEKPISRSRHEVQTAPTVAIQPDKKIYSRSRRDRKVSNREDAAEHDEKPLIKPCKTDDHDDHSGDHSEDHKDDETVSVKSDEKPSLKSATTIKIDDEEKHAAPDTKTSSTRSRRARKVGVNEKKHHDDVEDRPSSSTSARDQKTKDVEEELDDKSSTRSKRGGRRIVHSAAESATDKTEKIEQQDSSSNRGSASRNRAAAATRKKAVQDKITVSASVVTTSEVKESSSRRGGNRKKEVTEVPSTATTLDKPSLHQDESKSSKQEDTQSDHVSTILRTRTETQTENETDISTNTKEEVDVLMPTSEVSSSRRGRNVPQRRAATCHHNYDETSDTEKKEKRKKKPDSPKKTVETPKNVHLVDSISVETSLLSSSAVTARGRTRKPTARVQQFLEEERARAGTPKKRATDTPTKGKHLKYGDDADVAGGTLQTTNSHKDEPATTTTSPTTSKRRKGTRKAKVEDPDEPPAKKSPTVLEAKKEPPTPTRIADRRNAAAAALFRIEEDALATAAIDPPKKSRARKQPAKAAAAVLEKRDNKIVPTVAADDHEDPQQTDSSAKEDIKITGKRGTRKAAASTTEAAHAADDGLPAKRSRKGKVATEAHQSETEATADAKTKQHNAAATTRAGRKNVHFESADRNAESAATEETATATATAAATTTKRATRSRQV